MSTQLDLPEWLGVPLRQIPPEYEYNMGLLKITDRSVIRQLSFLGPVRLAPPGWVGWPCKPERERCSHQIEPHSQTSPPRRPVRSIGTGERESAGRRRRCTVWSGSSTSTRSQ